MDGRMDATVFGHLVVQGMSERISEENLIKVFK
jgi:hypothetical protein